MKWWGNLHSNSFSFNNQTPKFAGWKYDSIVFKNLSKYFWQELPPPWKINQICFSSFAKTQKTKKNKLFFYQNWDNPKAKCGSVDFMRLWGVTLFVNNGKIERTQKSCEHNRNVRFPVDVTCVAGRQLCHEPHHFLGNKIKSIINKYHNIQVEGVHLWAILTPTSGIWLFSFLLLCPVLFLSSAKHLKI